MVAHILVCLLELGASLSLMAHSLLVITFILHITLVSMFHSSIGKE
jgi:hypothetical protein